MANKKNNYKKLIFASIINTTLVTFLLVFVFMVYFSFGWFSSNTETNATGMSIKVGGLAGVSIEEYRVYLHNYDSEGVVEVSNNIENDDLYLADFELNPYDSILTEHNEYTRVLVRIIIDHVPTDKTTLNVNVSNTTLLANAGASLTEHFSNICAFRFIYADHEDDPEDVYDALTNDNTASVPFVTVTRDGNNFSNTKVASISLSLDSLNGSNSSYIYTENDVRKLCVYLEISYDDNLVKEYLLQNNENEQTFDDLLNASFDFIGDIGEIKLTYNE